jgi:hypothetical protein
MSTIYQEYRDRVQRKGETITKRDYVNKKVRESIDSLINDSQYGFPITVNDKEYNVAILSTSSTQDYEKANIIAHNEVGLDRGSLFKWNDEFWIILQKMFRPEQPGFNGYAYRCTGELKWIDENDELQIRPGYISSGRTTNSLTYTPDVNYKFENILLHDTDWSMIAAVQQDLTLHEEMRFIIKGKAYRVTNIDNVSIDNVSILSMVDDKAKDSDDLINGIADLKMIKEEYQLRCPVKTPVNLFAGDIKEIPIEVISNGKKIDEKLVFSSINSDVVEVKGNVMIGRGIGETLLQVSLAKNPHINTEIAVKVDVEHTTDQEEVYLQGPDYIAWNKTAVFKVSNEQKTDFEVVWQTGIKHDQPIMTDDSVTISIKDKYAGNIIIKATQGDKTLTKTIYIKTIEEE